MCRREIPRCGKRAGGHGTKGCVVLVEKVIRVNCRGAYVAGDKRCPVRERQVEVARLRIAQNVLYAETLKKAEDGSL